MKSSERQQQGSARPGATGMIWKVPLILILLAGIVVLMTDAFGLRDRAGRSTETTAAAPASPTAPVPTALPPTAASLPSSTPEPWYYDEANNQHWHAGHGHWHPGPPPPPEQRGETPPPFASPPMTAQAEPTPDPWYYDAEQNRHWHAAHGHWHPGPPPPESERDH